MATVEVVGTPLHILTGSAVTLSAQFMSDGVAADPGVTTLGITRQGDAPTIASGTATAGTGTNPRTYALGAAMTGDLDLLTVTWTTTNLGTVTTTHEVVGAFLFTVAEARAFDNAALASTTKYPTATIEEARARITDEFEGICGVSFIPRYRTVTVNGTGRSGLVLDRMEVTAVRSVETRSGAVWTAYTTDELDDVLVESWGLITRDTLGTFASGNRNVRIGFEHGYAAVPLDIKRAALMALRYELVSNDVSSRAISISNDQGTTQLWTPGISGRGSAVHPLPEVDRVLQQHIAKVPVIA